MTKKVLDNDGLKYLVEQLYIMMERKIDTRIVTSIDANSTNTDIPGTAAVYQYVLDTVASTDHIHFEVVTDEMPDVGESNVIYLVKAEGATTYTMNVYFDGEWVELGSTDINISEYWRKDELVALSNSEIQDILNEADEG